MRFDKFTLKAQEVIQEADSLVGKYNHSTLDVEHLLYALIEQKEGVIPPLLGRLGVDRGWIKTELEELLEGKPKAYGDTVQVQMAP